MGYGVRKVIILLYLNGFNITICLLPSFQRCFMKLPYLLVYGGIGLLTMSSSCDKEAQEVNPAPCSDAEIVPVPGFNWTLPAYCFKEPIAVIGQSKHYVIHSAAEYSAVATCSPPALNYGNVSANNRFRDVSLRVSAGGASIQSVRVVGADNSSYNASTGLVNVFKRQTTFADPAASWQRSSSPTSSSSAGNSPAPSPAPAASAALPSTAAEPLSAYPNPFTARTTLRFALPRSEKATLELRSLTGQLVRVLYVGTPSAEEVQTIELASTGLSQQLYIVRLITASKVFTKKLVLAQ